VGFEKGQAIDTEFDKFLDYVALSVSLRHRYCKMQSVGVIAWGEFDVIANDLNRSFLNSFYSTKRLISLTIEQYARVTRFESQDSASVMCFGLRQ
jgi:hypothetical protein